MNETPEPIHSRDTHNTVEQFLQIHETNVEALGDYTFRILYKQFVMGGSMGEEDLRDYIQDAFSKMITSIERFDGNSSIQTWFTSIARNIILDKLRFHRTRKKRGLLIGEHLQIDGESVLGNCTSLQPIPDENAMQEEACVILGSLIEEGVAKLKNPDEQEILRQMMLYSLKLSQIVDPKSMTSREYENLEQRIYRARQHIAGLVSQHPEFRE